MWRVTGPAAPATTPSPPRETVGRGGGLAAPGSHGPISQIVGRRPPACCCSRPRSHLAVKRRNLVGVEDTDLRRDGGEELRRHDLKEGTGPRGPLRGPPMPIELDRLHDRVYPSTRLEGPLRQAAAEHLVEDSAVLEQGVGPEHDDVRGRRHGFELLVRGKTHFVNVFPEGFGREAPLAPGNRLEDGDRALPAARAEVIESLEDSRAPPH